MKAKDWLVFNRLFVKRGNIKILTWTSPFFFFFLRYSCQWPSYQHDIFYFWVEQFKWLKCIQVRLKIYVQYTKWFLCWSQFYSVFFAQFYGVFFGGFSVFVFHLKNIDSKCTNSPSIETLLYIVTIFLMILLTLSQLNCWLTYRDVLSWLFSSWSSVFQIWSKRHTNSPLQIFIFNINKCVLSRREAV